MKRKLQQYWAALLLYLLSRVRIGYVKYSEPRTTQRFKLGKYEVEIEWLDTTKPDYGYDRVEMLQRLREIRFYERIQGWTCPEPTKQDIDAMVAERVLPEIQDAIARETPSVV